LFELHRADHIALTQISSPDLRLLIDTWQDLARRDALPRIGNLDPLQLGANLGRMHLLEVLGPRKFLFLLYGCAVTNPDAKSMSGLTTEDYDNKNFAQVVTTHYQEVVEVRRPVCRHIVATKAGKPYEYIRLTLPFSRHGGNVDLLLVGTHRLSIPVHLDWRRTDDDKSYVAALVEELKPVLGTSKNAVDDETVALIQRFGTALLWNVAQQNSRPGFPK